MFSIMFNKGDLILCTKYKDGLPDDPWCVGPFSHAIIEKDYTTYYCIQNSKGFPCYYKNAKKISKRQGKYLLEHFKFIETSGMPFFGG